MILRIKKKIGQYENIQGKRSARRTFAFYYLFCLVVAHLSSHEVAYVRSWYYVMQ